MARTEGKPASSGRLRTFQKVSSPKARDSSPATTNTARQE
jgi:hypothetical protein